MGIRVIDQPDVFVTADDLSRYRREWEKFCQYHANPPTLEEYIRTAQRLPKDVNIRRLLTGGAD